MQRQAMDRAATLTKFTMVERINGHWSISGRVDRASAPETVDLDSIPGRVKPTTIKLGIHNFPA